MLSALPSFGRRVWRRFSSGPGSASLRQCDWRLLLPTPASGVFDHLVLLGAPRGLAETILQAEIARRVSEKLPAAADADALVVLRRSNASIAVAARCLRPDGVAYWEIDRRRPRRWLTSVGWAFRRLRSAGLSPMSAYWVRPGFSSPQVYLPLGDDSVVRWYLRNNYTAIRWSGRVMEVLLRLLWALGVGLRERLIPAFALTASVNRGRMAASILGHPDLNRDLWRSVRRPRGSGRLSDLELLLLTGGRDDWNRVVAMPFPVGGTNPLAVLKLSRVSGRNIHTEREQQVLRAIRPAVDAEMRRTLPEAFGTFAWQGLTVGMESYLSGRLLAATSARCGTSLSRQIEDLNLAVQWLIEFHRQTECRRARWGEEELAGWSMRPLERYQELFGLTEAETSLFAKTRERYWTLAGGTFPIVWYHYAFSAWNICRENKEIGAFDWESAERGPALLDLIYLVFRWNQELGRGRPLRAFRDLFLGENGHPAIRAIRKAIERYVDALDIDARAFPVALVPLWAQHANTRALRARSLDGPSADVRRDNTYVAGLGVLAEDSETLFRIW